MDVEDVINALPIANFVYPPRRTPASYVMMGNIYLGINVCQQIKMVSAAVQTVLPILPSFNATVGLLQNCPRPNIDQLTVACPDKCTTCRYPNFNPVSSRISDVQCTGCVAGAGLDNGRCVNCPPATFIGPDNKCTGVSYHEHVLLFHV